MSCDPGTQAGCRAGWVSFAFRLRDKVGAQIAAKDPPAVGCDELCWPHLLQIRVRTSSLEGRSSSSCEGGSFQPLASRLARLLLQSQCHQCPLHLSYLYAAERRGEEVSEGQKLHDMSAVMLFEEHPPAFVFTHFVSFCAVKVHTEKSCSGATKLLSLIK